MIGLDGFVYCNLKLTFKADNRLTIFESLGSYIELSCTLEELRPKKEKIKLDSGSMRSGSSYFTSTMASTIGSSGPEDLTIAAGCQST